MRFIAPFQRRQNKPTKKKSSRARHFKPHMTQPKKGLAMNDKKNILIAQEIQNTIERLHLRITDRFCDSGLAGVCKNLHDISKETDKTAQWITKTNYPIRIIIYSIIILLCLGVVHSVSKLDVKADGVNIADLVQMIEAALNGLVLIGAGIVFLITIENRRKRKRVIKAINRLRCIAHIIDSHQLTKDPDSIAKINIPTQHSPKRRLDKYELGRYLNYCSEMLSLTSKLGFLYVQNFHDPIASTAANDLEALTTGLSQKIWQKLIIIRSRD